MNGYRGRHLLSERLPSCDRLYANVVTIDMAYGTEEVMVPASKQDANVVLSSLRNGLHAPVLDIDFHAALIPSSTPDHFHLYLDKAMTWRKYRRLLKALGRAGVLESGYVKASLRRRHSTVRKPGVYKPEAQL